MLTRQFALFVLAGGLAAAVNFGSRIVLSMSFDYLAAIVIAYGFGMLTAFLLNRAFVFQAANNRLRHQIGWFAAINLLAAAQTIVVSFVLARCVLPGIGLGHHSETIAHAVGVAIPVVTSYIGHKYFSFSSRQRH